MIQSVFFRIVLVITASFTIFKYSGPLPLWAYVIAIALYVGVYFILKRYDKSLLRMICDFAFINLIVWGRDYQEPTIFFLIFFLILLPMINAVNFSGTNRHSLILLLLTLGTMALHTGMLETWMLLPVLSLYILCLMSLIRNRERTLDINITSKIDEYFLSPVKLKSFEIYQSIIKDLNDYFKTTDDNKIQRIRVYSLKRDTMWLVNASTFMWERIVKLNPEELTRLKNKKRISQNTNEGVSLFYYIPKYEIEYVFVCDVHSDDNFLFHFRRFNTDTVLVRTFSKMSMLLNTEYRIAQRRDEKFNEIKDRVRYVNQAVRVMHYIRNKMTPLANVVAYHKMEDSLNPDLKNTMRKAFNKEVGRADNDLRDILKYADYLLDESNNPFGELRIAEIPISKIFILLSELAQSQLDLEVLADENITSKTRDNERVVHFNITNCKIMFTDWIANMRKNNSSTNIIRLSMVEDKLLVHFENTYSETDDYIQRLIRDINSTAKDAVLEGKNYGHGIYYIKELARDYSIDLHSKAGTTSDGKSTIILELKFKTYERKEDTNI